MLHIASSQKTFVRSVVNIVREFGEMCGRAHAHTLEGTLTGAAGTSTYLEQANINIAHTWIKWCLLHQWIKVQLC